MSLPAPGVLGSPGEAQNGKASRWQIAGCVPQAAGPLTRCGTVRAC